MLRGEAMMISEGKTVKQVELSSEYVKKLAAKHAITDDEEDEDDEDDDEGVNFYETKRVKKKKDEDEDVDVEEGREMELSVQWSLIRMTVRSASICC